MVYSRCEVAGPTGGGARTSPSFGEIRSVALRAMNVAQALSSALSLTHFFSGENRRLEAFTTVATAILYLTNGHARYRVPA
jgi:hypothetical protein